MSDTMGSTQFWPNTHRSRRLPQKRCRGELHHGKTLSDDYFGCRAL